MTVRRTYASPLRRRVALAAVPLLLTPLAACGDDSVAADAMPLSGEVSTGASEPESSPPVSTPAGAASSDPSESPGPDSPAPDSEGGSGKGGRSGSTKTVKPGEVEGGGFARSVPGSDAPDRKVDVGPQYTVSQGLDVKEIERLVKAVERIAKAQASGAPLVEGGSLAAAVGTFSYRWFDDGTVRPDPAWVAANIRTESVPILGAVTGHRVMLPQLRGALREVVARGLADKIHPGEFGGCYVPRFIAHDPSKGLSLHTWGIAVDINVPGNQRGTVGEIDRQVVGIFKRWGFAWGGDWSYTDPMHFELARVVKAR
jgi:hypothetical protein